MRCKIIACEVFRHELEWLLNNRSQLHPNQLKNNEFDLEFIALGEHARPDRLRSLIQEKIDVASGRNSTACPEVRDQYDAILLAYALCGRSTIGLEAREIPLVIPRCHDCCAMLLGSQKRFDELFGPKSFPYSSIGWIRYGEYSFSGTELIPGNAYQQWVERYGPDNARMIWEAMNPRDNGQLLPVYFISTPEIPADQERSLCREKAEKEGRTFYELEGSLRLLTVLLSGNWPEDEFLVVPPGKKTTHCFEPHQIIGWE